MANGSSTLAEALTAQPETGAGGRVGTVNIRGKDVAIRALTAFEMDLLQDVQLRPGAPYIVRPGTHPETGPMMVNEQDPKYLRSMEKWLRRLRTLEFAAASGYQAGGAAFSASMGDAALRAWASGVLAVLLGPGTEALLDDELVRSWSAVRDLADPVGKDGERIEAAKKALSELRPEELAQVLASLSPIATG